MIIVFKVGQKVPNDQICTNDPIDPKDCTNESQALEKEQLSLKGKRFIRPSTTKT